MSMCVWIDTSQGQLRAIFQRSFFFSKGFPGGSAGKESACSAGDLGSILGSGRSPGEGHSNPLQYSCLENPMDRGAGGLQPMGSQRIGQDWSDMQWQFLGRDNERWTISY